MARDSGDGAHLQKAVLQGDDHDPLASIRQASYGPREQCNDLASMIQGIQSSNLIGRLDQVTNGAFKTQGIELSQLDNMVKTGLMGGAPLNANDRQFLTYMRDNFGAAAGAQGNPDRMTRSEMANFLGRKAQEVCATDNGQGQGQYPPNQGRKLKR